jgi:hypothetical protein
LPHRLAVKRGWKRRADKLALPHDMISLIRAASDLVLRFAVGQLRQEARYFVDAVRLIVVALGREVSNPNGVQSGIRPNANQITNHVAMLSHDKQTNLPRPKPHIAFPEH